MRISGGIGVLSRVGLTVRHRIRVLGIVQGVGFRPAVHRLATSRALCGHVRNDGLGVWIEIEGEADAVRAFPQALRDGAPPLSRIDAVEVTELPPLREPGFRVLHSEASTNAATLIPADAATCDACLRELWDAADRRYRYPFLNCTDCGPRYTLVRELPYDRARTTMDRFPLCERCREEYEDPSDRRFHAEPTACPACGPTVALWQGGACTATADEAMRAAARLISEGGIVAVKGLGGFFLAADARSERAVKTLRERKRRADKPFALMARDLREAGRVVRMTNGEQALLAGSARPIVLLPKTPDADVAPSVAPRMRELGVMLPYTPLHHLLLHDGPPLVVMTSGNVADEPIARTNEDAQRRLVHIADALLLHDRDIHTRVDDSVIRAGRMIRRARGFVPAALKLPVACEEGILAVGAEQKGAVCLTRGGEAHLSQHLGDLKNAEALAFFEETISRLSALLRVAPRVVAHDLHPDYQSTRWAARSGLAMLGVQHHHAHIASCLAEHGRTGPVLGVAFDGTGCGPRGELWGGEFLIAALGGFTRYAHLRPIALAGGEAAIREVWRLAVAALLDAAVPLEALAQATPPGANVEGVRALLERSVASPRATGAGRWFDAVAALCGVRHQVTYEGQAAIELEALSADGPVDGYPAPLAQAPGGPLAIDLRPTVRRIADELRAGTPVPLISARFHETLTTAICTVAERARAERGLCTVALSGGCFQNLRLLERTEEQLQRRGFEVLSHRAVPSNDGGIALGQAAIAAYRMNRKGGGPHVSGDPR